MGHIDVVRLFLARPGIDVNSSVSYSTFPLIFRSLDLSLWSSCQTNWFTSSSFQLSSSRSVSFVCRCIGWFHWDRSTFSGSTRDWHQQRREFLLFHAFDLIFSLFLTKDQSNHHKHDAWCSFFRGFSFFFWMSFSRWVEDNTFQSPPFSLFDTVSLIAIISTIWFSPFHDWSTESKRKRIDFSSSFLFHFPFVLKSTLNWFSMSIFTTDTAWNSRKEWTHWRCPTSFGSTRDWCQQKCELMVFLSFFSFPFPLIFHRSDQIERQNTQSLQTLQNTF